MSCFEIASNYASAFFSLLTGEEKKENESVDSILTAFDTFIAIMRSNPLLGLFLRHPLIEKSKKQSFLEKIFPSDLTVSFLLYVIEKNKLPLFPEIVAILHELIRERRGELQAILMTAHPIEEEVVNTLKRRLEEHFQKRSTITIIIKPQIVTGFLLTVGNRMIDLSLRGRLNQMKRFLLQGGVDATQT